MAAPDGNLRPMAVDPYDDPDYVRLHDGRYLYLTGPVNLPHTEFEVAGGSLDRSHRERPPHLQPEILPF